MVSKKTQGQLRPDNVVTTGEFRSRLDALIGKTVGVAMYSNKMRYTGVSYPLLVTGVLERPDFAPEMYRVVGEGGACHAYFEAYDAFCIDSMT